MSQPSRAGGLSPHMAKASGPPPDSMAAGVVILSITAIIVNYYAIVK